MKEKFLDVLRGLFESDGRPAELESVDILLTAYLVLKGALENPVRGSGSTLGTALNITEPTVKASTTRLREAGWLQIHSGKSRRQANIYSVVLEALPVAQNIKRTVITTDAWTLAQNYMRAMPNNSKGRPRRFRKAERQRIAFALQTFLDRYTKGDVQLLRDVLNFAMNHPKHALKARRGPHELRRPFAKILAEFKQGGATQTAQPAKPSAQAAVDPDMHPWDVPPLPSETGQAVYKFQNLVAVGLDNFRTALITADLQQSDATLFVVQSDGSRSEQRVGLIKFGSRVSLADLNTGKQAA